VTDALLGAVAMGDIGQRFPDTDPANRDRDSGEMLRDVWTEVAQAGWSVVNLDMIVFAERPKLAPHAVAIRHRIAELLDTTPDRVGLKAKTGEGLAPIGTEEAIMAECVVLLQKS
jgi:2-C-methyl-D-erythritol 2,4-cyclodiphosphate synthase